MTEIFILSLISMIFSKSFSMVLYTRYFAVYQTISPLISTGFLQLGGWTIGLIFFNSYQLIGFTNAILGIILMSLVFLDIKHYSYLYSYEKLRKKRREIQKRKKRNKKQIKKAEKQEKSEENSLN